MKKFTAMILAVLMAFNFTLMVFAEEEEPPIQGEDIEEYVNTKSAGATLSINTSGTVTVDIACYGFSGTTHISSTTYLEKQSGSSWVRVSFNGMSQINDGASASYLSRTYTTTVGSGTYRATAIFTVTRGGVDETVTVYSNTVTH